MVLKRLSSLNKYATTIAMSRMGRRARTILIAWNNLAKEIPIIVPLLDAVYGEASGLTS
jgi:hypothetical protein